MVKQSQIVIYRYITINNFVNLTATLLIKGKIQR